MSYQARPYQTEALDSIFNSYFRPNPVRRQIVMLPTGMGKTVVFSLMTHHPKMQAHLGKFSTVQQKLLVLAHREELLNQAADKIGKANPQLVVEIEQADRRVSPMTDIVVASVQTLIRRLKKFNPDDFRAIVVDEAHHAIAPSYTKIFQHFGCLPPDTFGEEKPQSRNPEDIVQWQRQRLKDWDFHNPEQPLLVGFTATPKRSDKVGLEAVFEEIVYSMNMRDGIAQGWLTPLRAIKVESSTSLDAVSTQAGDFNIGELGDAVNNEERNHLAVKAWLEHAVGRKTVAFCTNVQHSHDLADHFLKNGISAAAISGKTDPNERRRILADFSSGKLQVVTNCNILTEGFDEPNIQCVLHARPTKSSILYIQMTGRGTRLFPGKNDCLIIDVVDVTRRHSLLTAPELFGLPPGFDAKGDDLMKVAKKVEDVKAQNPSVNASDIKSVEDLDMRVHEIDLWTSQYNTELVQKHATMNWAMESEEAYTLPLRAKNGVPECMQIKQNILGQWEVIHNVGGKRKKVGNSVPSIAAAFRHGEDFVFKERPENVSISNRNAPWRMKPPTPGQLAYARSLGIPHHLAKNSGELSDMIDAANRKKKPNQKAKFVL